MNSETERGWVAESAREVGGGFLRIVYGLIALIVAGGVYFGLGAGLGFWSPALAAAVLGLFGGLGFLLWRRGRYVVAAASGLGGAAAGMLLGSTEGLGLKLALGGAVFALIALWLTLLEIFGDA